MVDRVSASAFVERVPRASSGAGAIAIGVALLVVALFGVWVGLVQNEGLWYLGIAALAGFGAMVVAAGFVVLKPGEATVLTLFGSYIGTLRDPGIHWVNPFAVGQRVSLRVQMLETNTIKVNDVHGSPIHVAMVVSWRIANPAAACFNVEQVRNFVQTQADATLRKVAASLPYEHHQDGEDDLAEAITLIGDPEAVADQLTAALGAQLHEAGVELAQARVSHLAYGEEIAAAMLQRQQAKAIIGARALLVKGAVDIVQGAVTALAANSAQASLTAADQSRLAANLLVVLCGEQRPQPTVSVGG